MHLEYRTWQRHGMLSQVISQRKGGLSRVLHLILVVTAIAATLHAQAGSSSDLRRHLYVVDSDNVNMASKLLVVDPQRKTIIRSYRADYHPDVALSPDGKRLYLSYDYVVPPDQKSKGNLQVIDTTTGAVIASVSDPDRQFSTLEDTNSYMATSTDGRFLYALKLKTAADNTVSYGVAVFDTVKNEFLPDMVSLPMCDEAVLVPSHLGHALSVVCRGTRDVRTAHFGAQGIPINRIPVGIPLDRGNFDSAEIATAFSSGDNELTVVLTDGNYVRVNLETRKTIQQGTIAISLAGTVEGLVGPYQTPERQGKVFLTLARLEDYRSSGLAAATVVLDVKSLRVERVIEPKKCFSNVAIGSDGNLFVLHPEGAIISILGLPEGTEKDKMEGVGINPTMVFAAQ